MHSRQTARLDRKAEEDHIIGEHVPVGEQNPSRGRLSAQQIAKSGEMGEEVVKQSNIVNLCGKEAKKAKGARISVEKA